MQITVQNQINPSIQSNEAPIELKQGEVYKAQIKEKLSDSEALISIRGREIKAKFEGGVPAGDRPTVQVTGKQEQLALVKEIIPEAPKGKQAVSSEAKVFKSVGLTAGDSPELKQAVKLIFDKGQPLSKEVVQELKTFFEKAEGTTQSKNDTIKALVNKGLEVTQTHLRSIHEALHGKPLNEVLTNIAKEVNPNFDPSKEPVSEFSKQKIVKEPVSTPVVEVKKGQEKSQTSQHVIENKKHGEIIANVRKMVEQEPDLQKAIQKVKDEIIANPKIDREHVKQIEKAAYEAEKLQSIGKERLVQALKTAETQIAAKEPVQKSEQFNVKASSETVSLKNLINEVRTNPNLQKSIEKVQTEILKNNLIPSEKTGQVEKAINEASTLLRQGRITTGKEVLSRALLEIENDVNRFNENKQLLNTSKQSEAVKQVIAAVKQEPNLQKAVEQVREQVVNNPKLDREVAQKVERAVREAVQLQQIGRESAGRERLVQALNQAEVEQTQVESRKANVEPRPSEVVKQVKETVQQEPKLQKAVDQVREQVVNNPKIDRETAQKVEKAVHEAVQLQQAGKEGSGREKLVQALNQAEVELSQAESRRANAEARPNEVVKQVKEGVQQEPKLQKAVDQVREQVLNNPKIDRETAQKVERAVREAVQLQQAGREGSGREKLVQALNQAEVELSQSESRRANAEARPSEVMKQVKEAVQQEPKLQKAVDQVREQVLNNPKIDRETAQKVDKAVREEVQLQQVSKEGAGREKLVQALNQAEVELSQAESRRANAEARPSEVVKQVKEAVQQEPKLQKAVEQIRDQVVNNPRIDREVAQKVERAVRETVQLQQVGKEGVGREKLVQALKQAEAELSQSETRRSTSELRPSEAIKQVKEAVQREPKLQKAVDQVRDQVVNNPKIDREVAQKVERTAREAVQLQQAGREGLGREKLVQALTQAEVELSQAESRKSIAETKPSEFVKQVKESVQQETRLQKAADQVRDQIVNNPKINPEVAKSVDKAVREAEVLQRAGKETTGRERLTEVLTKAQTELTKMESSAQRDSQQVTLKDSIKQIREQLQTEADIKKVLPKVHDQIINDKNIKPEVARDIEKAAKQANQLDQAGRDRLVKMLQQVEQSLKQPASNQEVSTVSQPEKQVNQAQNITNQPQPKVNENQEEVQQPQIKLPSETIKQALKQLQSEANLDEALNLVRKEISSNPNINLDHVGKIEKAIEQAEQLNDKGREMAARQHISRELSDLQQTVAKAEPRISEGNSNPVNQYELNEQLQSLQIQSKDILVTKITQKLAEVTREFRELKREITRNLDSVKRIIDTYKQNAYPQAKQMLETAISKLDNTILKSDMMLFTDMKTERELLQASSQLADAKKLLAKGDFSQASKIVGEVKDLIDKMNFKPSDQKVMHYVGKESLALENKGNQALLENAARGFTMTEPSARQMFETVRSMGLNHDSELANSLVFKNGDQSQQEQQQHQNNIKAVLMKLQNEEAGTRVAQQAEQALNNLTGQQLLSKSDSSGTMQSMLFNLPMLLGGNPENIQVYVNSQNEGQQVDWENCNLYFLLETKKLGDVGIMLSSTDRNLSITVKNDKPGFKEKMVPIASLAKERLKDIGYNVGSIHITRMTPVQAGSSEGINQESESIKQKEIRPIFTEKGMDFKI
ncbi:hypothetical protein [Bacillus dakarensis]|uniref:hypothetical protein n=1 Tax=Robertmurraya dakarensis TaxID=1926278 RepID=UPI0009824D44|nr:hypothetical protein [Bacillus dakarensis]